MRHSFFDLATVTDEFHALFDAWAEAGRFHGTLQDESVDVLRLAIHEWIANLVQHATFRGDVEISLALQLTGAGVSCSIEDTSMGFDFAGQVEHQRAVLDAPAPSERGRGLLMLEKCTEALDYTEAADGQRQRIAFTVRDLGEEIFAPLFASATRNDRPSYAPSGPPRPPLDPA
ncbi:MAG: ATP-binding protein [Bacteroidota bacterium]